MGGTFDERGQIDGGRFVLLTAPFDGRPKN